MLQFLIKSTESVTRKIYQEEFIKTTLFLIEIRLFAFNKIIIYFQITFYITLKYSQLSGSVLHIYQKLYNTTIGYSAIQLYETNGLNVIADPLDMFGFNFGKIINNFKQNRIPTIRILW